jgi:hypothetical protein
LLTLFHKIKKVTLVDNEYTTQELIQKHLDFYGVSNYSQNLVNDDLCDVYIEVKTNSIIEEEEDIEVINSLLEKGKCLILIGENPIQKNCWTGIASPFRYRPKNFKVNKFDRIICLNNYNILTSIDSNYFMWKEIEQINFTVLELYKQLNNCRYSYKDLYSWYSKELSEINQNEYQKILSSTIDEMCQYLTSLKDKNSYVDLTTRITRFKEISENFKRSIKDECKYF